MSEESEWPTYQGPSDDLELVEACRQAQETFRLFWREVWWERHRIIPAFDYMIVKLPFADDPWNESDTEGEHMWINDVAFDGQTLSGVLINSPKWLQSVSAGDHVSAPLEQLEDWIYVCDGKAYGAFTVQAIRLGMSASERREHDEAWEVDFGDPRRPRIETYAKQDKPAKSHFGSFGSKRQTVSSASDGHVDHPTCREMLETYEVQLTKDASIAVSQDDDGWTHLHWESMGGSLCIVKLLVEYGANPRVKTPQGMNAIDLAKVMGWNEITRFLESEGN